MKQVLLSIMMLLCVGNAFGQTSAKLIEKYKALPGAVYENTTNESLKGLEKGDTILSADEIANEETLQEERTGANPECQRGTVGRNQQGHQSPEEPRAAVRNSPQRWL